MSQGTNLDLILNTDYLSIDDEKILKEQQEKEKITLGEGVSLAIKQEQILPSILRSFSGSEYTPDYDFRIDIWSIGVLTFELLIGIFIT